MVKAFNHIAAADITADARPGGESNRRALVAASDSDEGLEFVRRLYDRFGFDTVALNPLSEGWRIQRDTPGYGAKASEAELVEALAAAKRYGDLG